MGLLLRESTAISKSITQLGISSHTTYGAPKLAYINLYSDRSKREKVRRHPRAQYSSQPAYNPEGIICYSRHLSTPSARLYVSDLTHPRDQAYRSMRIVVDWPGKTPRQTWHWSTTSGSVCVQQSRFTLACNGRVLGHQQTETIQRDSFPNASSPSGLSLIILFLDIHQDLSIVKHIQHFIWKA